MGIVFKGLHPLFGRGTKPLGLAYQQRSPYYWWWEFMRRNDEYRACCNAGGTGALEALFKDWGDIQSSTFRTWWTERGYYLFGEQPKPVRLAELTKPSEWETHWTSENVMVVAVPLDLPKRDLQRFFGELLKRRHRGKRGRKAAADTEASTARYPLHRAVSVHTLRIQLAVYDAVMAKKRGEDRRTLAKIGEDMRLVPSAMPKANDTAAVLSDKRAVMAATVSRHFKLAARIVENTVRGQFPDSN